MTDPEFPFEADFDADAHRAERGPVDRRQLVGVLVIAAAGAVLVGLFGVVAVLETAIDPGGLAAIALSGVGPVAAWVSGAVVALIVLVRRGRRAWLPMLSGVLIGLIAGVSGVAWWLAGAGLL